MTQDASQMTESSAEQSAVTIVVPCLNEEKHIETLLESIFCQTFPRELISVIVADGDSTDSTIARIEEACERHCWPLTAHGAPPAQGKVSILANLAGTTPAAMNLGVSSAITDVVVLVGAHAELDKNFIAAGVETLSTSGATVVGACPEIVSDNSSSAPVALAQLSRIATGSVRHSHSMETNREVDTAPYPMFRRSTWLDVGGFDEELHRNQDDEFLQRVREQGGSIILSPKVRFRYFSRPTIRGLSKQYFQYGRYRILTIRKRGRPGSLRPMAPLVLIPVLSLPPALLRFSNPIVGLLPSTAYALLLLAEGARLNQSAGTSAIRTATAIGTMHLSYGIGMWAGLLDFVLRKNPS